MGTTQSSSRSVRGFSPYASDSPTRTFVSGSTSLRMEPISFWASLFREYFLLRTAPRVPRSLLRSLDAATRALTRAVGRPDQTDAVNVSMMFRVAVSFIRSYTKKIHTSGIEVSRNADQPAEKASFGDDVSEDQVRGAILLLTAVSTAFLQSEAGRDRIYRVLGSSGKGINGDHSVDGENLAIALVQSLCDCLVALPVGQYSDLKGESIDAIIALLSARLYADRSLSTGSVAFLPCFNWWAGTDNNGQQLIQSLLQNTAVETARDPHRFHRVEADDSHLYPDSTSQQLLTEAPSSIAAEEEGSATTHLLQRLRGTYTASMIYETLVDDAKSSPVEDESKTGPTDVTLARSSILLILLLVFGSERTEATNGPFQAAFARIVNAEESTDAADNSKIISRKTLFGICQHWILDDRGMFLTYGLFMTSINFRRYATERFVHGGVSSPLFQVFRSLLRPDRKDAHPETSYIPNIVLELVVEDEEFCKELDCVQLPFECLTDELHLCSLEEAKTMCEPNMKTVRLGLVVALVAIHCAQRIPTDNFLLNLSVSVLGNIAQYINNVVHHAAWSLVALLDSLSSRYRSYSGSTAREKGEDNSDEEWDEDMDQLSGVLGLMVEAVAGVVFGVKSDGSAYIRNAHVLLALYQMRDSLFDADSGVTIMILKNREASKQCILACSRLKNLIAQVANIKRASEKNERDSDFSEGMLEDIQLLPLTQDENESREVTPLRFRYVEDISAFDFFAPYVWSIAHGRTSLVPAGSNMRFLKITDPNARETVHSVIKSPSLGFHGDHK